MSSERLKQVVVPRKRAPRTRRITPPSFDWSILRERAGLIARIAAGLVLAILLFVVYKQVVALSAFQLRNVEVSGSYRISSQEIEKAVRQNLANSLLTSDLHKLQNHLEAFTWVQNAEIVRILPDTLRVSIKERKPLALVRFNSQLPSWIDEEGVILGDYDSTLDKDVPPLIFGFAKDASSTSHAENQERIQLYKNLMRALDNGPAKYSQLVEEIDLSNIKDVRLQLSQGAVEVDLGDKDFRPRLTRALNILDALRRRDREALKDYKFDSQILEEPEKIRFISVVHPTQVAIRPSRTTQSHTPTDKVARAEEGR